MSSNDRDLHLIKKILKYCNEANETIQRFGDSIDELKSDSIYQNATAMCVLQVGELAKHLSDSFVATHFSMPWKQIKGMRDRVAHGYENFDTDILWQTLKTDLPTLQKYCNKIIIEENLNGR